MRKVRSRLTILLLILVAISSSVSVLLAVLTMNGHIFSRGTMRYVLFGFAIKDILLLLLVAAVVLIVLLAVSRTTTNPILELNRAIRQVADGNYDVQVNIRDRIEEFGELQRNFNIMVEQLKKNEYLRKDFISNVSHELKTPLSIMEGYADLLEEDDLPAQERQAYARMISGEARRLTALTTNMLRLSAIENAEIHPKKDVFQLDEQLRQTVLKLEPKWTAKHLDLTLELEPVRLAGDEDLLNQVWLNLLDNAVKFTGDGGSIHVGLRLRGGTAVVSVADSGIGMDPETMARMFEQFYRGNTKMRYEGSGLGLPLARRIVQLHNGSISARSAPDAGTEFTVTLPAERIE